jgi:hypothetical protein
VGGICDTHEEGRRVYRVLVGKPEVKRPLGRPRRRWDKEIGIDEANWISLAQDRVQWRVVVNTVMNLRFHKESSIFFGKLSDNQFFLIICCTME